MKRRLQFISFLMVGGFFVFPLSAAADQTWEMSLSLGVDGDTEVLQTIVSDSPFDSWELLAPKVDLGSIQVFDETDNEIDFTLQKTYPDLMIEFPETSQVSIGYSAPQTVREFSDHDEWVFDLLAAPASSDINLKVVDTLLPVPLKAGIQPRLYVIPPTKGTAETIISEQVSSSSYRFMDVKIPAGQKAVVITPVPKEVISFVGEGFWVKYGYLILAIFLVSPLTLVLVLFARWRKLGRDPREMIDLDVKDVPVALVGVVKDEFVGHKDVCAAIFDLAARGIVQFSQVKGEWYIERKRAPKNLPKFEAELLRAIFGKKKRTSLGSRVALRPVVHEIYKEVAERKYFSHNPHRTRMLYFLFGACFVLIGYVGIIFLYGIPIFLLGFVLLIFGVFMPQKTYEGVGIYHHARERRDQVRVSPVWNDLPWVCLFGERDEFLLHVKGRVPSYIKGARSKLDVNTVIEVVHVFTARGIHIA